MSANEPNCELVDKPERPKALQQTPGWCLSPLSLIRYRAGDVNRGACLFRDRPYRRPALADDIPDLVGMDLLHKNCLGILTLIPNSEPNTRQSQRSFPDLVTVRRKEM